jgi:hypothetical protein
LQDLKKQTALRLAQEQQQTFPEEVEQQVNERTMRILPPEHAHLNRHPTFGSPQNFVDVSRMNENSGNQNFTRYDGQVMADNTNNNRERKPFRSSQTSPTLHIVSQSKTRSTVIIIEVQEPHPCVFAFRISNTAPTVLREEKSLLI